MGSGNSRNYIGTKGTTSNTPGNKSAYSSDSIRQSNIATNAKALAKQYSLTTQGYFGTKEKKGGSI